MLENQRLRKEKHSKKHNHSPGLWLWNMFGSASSTSSALDRQQLSSGRYNAPPHIDIYPLISPIIHIHILSYHTLLTHAILSNTPSHIHTPSFIRTFAPSFIHSCRSDHVIRNDPRHARQLLHLLHLPVQQRPRLPITRSHEARGGVA